MGNAVTSIACMTGQSISLTVMETGMVLRASLLVLGNIAVLRVKRNRLQRLANDLNVSPQYRVMVDGNPTTLTLSQYSLLNNSLIICRVVNNQIDMHGLEDGREKPRQGDNINWNIVGQNYDNGQYDAMNLGSGTIQNP